MDETKILLQQSGERLVIRCVLSLAPLCSLHQAETFRNNSRVATDLSSFDTLQYSLTPLPSTFHPILPHATSSTAPPQYHLGEPISVAWAAPANHSPSDWIGIYRVGANSNQLITKVSSQGKWQGVRPRDWVGDDYDDKGEASSAGAKGDDTNRGTVTFEGKRLPWTVGTYEIR